MNWKRPENLPYPSIWAKFEGKKEVNGVKNQYWVQDLTSEYYDDVLYHMSHSFVRKSPMCVYTNFVEDQQSVDEYLVAWRKMFDQRLTLICLTKDANNVIKFVGSNILTRKHKGEHVNVDKLYKGKAAHVAGAALNHLYQNAVDVFTKLDIEEYIAAFGLYVVPEYQGDGIGYQILKARREICLGVGIPVSLTVFTTNGGQALAEKDGYKNLFEIPYKDMEKINPLFRFPGIENGETKTVKLMYKRYK